jgi:HSP20 family protein
MITLFKDPFFDVFDKVFEPSYVSSTTPQINISKNENNYKLLMSVPGLTKEDVKITTKEGILTISFDKEEKTDKTYFVSTFKKSYTIPEDVREKDIEGRVENGILELLLPIDRKKSVERLISLN